MQKIRSYFARRGFALRPTLMSSVTIIIVLTTAAIAIPAYLSETRSIFLLWGALAKNISERASERTLRYFQDAPFWGKFVTELVERGDLHLDKTEEIFDIGYGAMKEHRNFSAIFFAKSDGSFFRMYEEKNECFGGLDCSIDRTSARCKEYQLDGKEWVYKEEFRENFDSRTRPFWKYGLDHPDGAWTQPYEFYFLKKPGITYVIAQNLDGKFLGLWGVDFEIGYISSYLAEIEEETSAEIFLMADDGTMIGDSRTAQDLANLSQEDIEAENQIIYGIWKQACERQLQYLPFEYKDHYAFVAPFPKNYGLKWNIVALIHKELFFGRIRQLAWFAIGTAIVLCAIFISLSSLFFGHISKRLKEIAVDMGKAETFDFTEEVFANKPSLVKEVNTMSTALDKMKIGLSSFSKYVPRDLVMQLINSGHAATPGGKKEEITILFTDLANFTKFSENVDVDLLLEVLNEYLREMSALVSAHQGTVDKYLGDGILAFWGAPLPLPEHAHLACQAALVMKEKLGSLWKKYTTEHKALLHQRIGINTGSVVVGNIGSLSRMEYTAIGDPVNLASRLQGLNKYYGTQILIGEETAKRVEDIFVLRPLDWVAVKGRSHSILVHELIEKKESATKELLEAIAIYKEGLGYYREQKFDLAIACFERVKVLFGGEDHPSQELIVRCQQFLKKPPSAHWDGSTILEYK